MHMLLDSQIFPVLNPLPDSVLHVTLGAFPELSVTVGLIQVTIADDLLNSVHVDWLFGQNIIGA